MILDNSLISIPEVVVDHAKETKTLRVLWFDLQHPVIISSGLFVISREAMRKLSWVEVKDPLHFSVACTKIQVCSSPRLLRRLRDLGEIKRSLE